MERKFHERFDIEVDIDETKRRFVNRVSNEVFHDFLYHRIDEKERLRVRSSVITRLGEHYGATGPLDSYIKWDFYKTLQAFEVFYHAVSSSIIARAQANPSTRTAALDEIINRLLREAETDLGIRWEHGCFVRSGAESLDQPLVNDVLHWLRNKSYGDVLAPYEKGLRHFIEADKRPEVLADVVTDTYEAVEALAKIITGRQNYDLSKNAELFIKTVKASDEYKSMLKGYIDYANRFRHSPTPAKARPMLSVSEVESFLYLTGIFIRLAMTSST